MKINTEKEQTMEGKQNTEGMKEKKGMTASEYITGLLRDISKEPQIKSGNNGELYISLPEKEFQETVPVLDREEFILLGLFCVQDFEGENEEKGEEEEGEKGENEENEEKGGKGGKGEKDKAEAPAFTLFYAFRKRGFSEVFVFLYPVETEASSIARTFPSACWYEREIRDGFGLDFPDAFDKRRLFLHEAYPEGFHPLLKSFKNGKIRTIEKPQENYPFKQLEGEGVYQIPVGPVHAGIIEPGHFRFSVIGEPIFNLEIRMFYKHRGIEKLAEGKPPAACLPIAEAISGDESAANSVAFCMAVEKLAGLRVPERAEYLRAVLLELERIHSHLGDLAGMATDVGFPRITSPFLILREEIFRQNDVLTGSRFLKGAVDIGGMKQDIPDKLLEKLASYLENFEGRFEKAFGTAMSSSSLIDRFATTGVIKKKLITPLNLTGPIARASGAAYDVRMTHPYGIYGKMPPERKVLSTGDVLSRFEVKAAEVRASGALIRKLVLEIPAGPVLCLPPVTGIQDGFALSMVEAPRGQTLHWVYVKNGLIDRYKVRTASFCNWKAVEHAVLDNIVPDFPLINKSLNLSYAGTDL
jgi:formate hydrogenlyase subunit 5